MQILAKIKDPARIVNGLRRRFRNLRQACVQACVVGYRKRVLAARVRHVSGKKAITYGANELLVSCIVRNGSKYMKSFMEHYRSMGVRHIVFLDNGSTDETVALASSYDDVTVLAADVPFGSYQCLMRDYLVRRFSTGRWNLHVDIDELFDYPGSNVVSLENLLHYLNEKGFTAVVAQMLDLFSDTPLSKISDRAGEDLKNSYIYYDLSEIEKMPYRWTSNGDILMHMGGIRKTVFGTRNGLTKAPLVFVGPGILLFQEWHHAANTRIADFTCVLYHYPFTGSFFEKVREAVESKRHGIFTYTEYDLYWKRLSREPDLNLCLDTARRSTGVDSLLDEGFLVASPAYLEWVQAVSASS
jgi:hypothetical protein